MKNNTVSLKGLILPCHSQSWPRHRGICRPAHLSWLIHDSPRIWAACSSSSRTLSGRKVQSTLGTSDHEGNVRELARCKKNATGFHQICKHIVLNSTFFKHDWLISLWRCFFWHEVNWGILPKKFTPSAYKDITLPTDPRSSIRCKQYVRWLFVSIK